MSSPKGRSAGLYRQHARLSLQPRARLIYTRFDGRTCLDDVGLRPLHVFQFSQVGLLLLPGVTSSFLPSAYLDTTNNIYWRTRLPTYTDGDSCRTVEPHAPIFYILEPRSKLTEGVGKASSFLLVDPPTRTGMASSLSLICLANRHGRLRATFFGNHLSRRFLGPVSTPSPYFSPDWAERLLTPQHTVVTKRMAV